MVAAAVGPTLVICLMPHAKARAAVSLHPHSAVEVSAPVWATGHAVAIVMIVAGLFANEVGLQHSNEQSGQALQQLLYSVGSHVA